MSKQSKYLEDLRNSQFGHKFGGTYITAREMLKAVMDWADYNFDDWSDVARDIEDVKFGDMMRLLQARCDECEGYYRKPGSAVYERDELVDFVRSKNHD